MNYAYETAELATSLILGTTIRGLGKGWKVGVLCSDNTSKLIKKFRNLLQKKTQFKVIEKKSELIPVQLLIREYPENIQSIQANHVIDLVIKANASEYDLVSNIHFSTLNPRGITAITGNGKGKTTLALGMAGQNNIAQNKSVIIQWFKEKKSGDLTWAINEHFFPDLLKNSELMVFFPTGLGFFGSPNMDRVKGEQAYQQHRKKAYEGLELARNLIASGEYTCVVLDELVDTVKEIAHNIEYPLIDLKDLQEFLTWAVEQPVHIVVTGRRVTSDWQDFVQTSIVVSEIKHPWSTSKKGAISGLDF